MSNLCLDCREYPEANAGGICERCLAETGNDTPEPTVDEIVDSYLHDCKRLGNEPDEAIVASIIKQGKGA